MLVTRRLFLAATAATALAPAIRSSVAVAQTGQTDQTEQPVPAGPEEQTAQQGQAFSFDILSEEMRNRASEPHENLEEIGGYLADLNYDAYRLIRYDPERQKFGDIENSNFRLQAFHMGWLFNSPMHLFEIHDGRATPINFNTDDFIYQREARDLVPEHEPLPGIAGFRLHYPLNRPDVFDELLAFQGASYFRALGRNSTYGLSARGLAVNTGGSEEEEFPVFTRFYVDRPVPGARHINVYAALESPSLTGAYRFVVTPGTNTIMETTARLFLRTDIPQLGIAPLTSMFLFAERNREAFNDYRPQVHDSEGLAIETQQGKHIWRPLSNPPHLASSYFAANSPRNFGLYQRDRQFQQYQDASAWYERRPSLKVEPIGDWGKGSVRLVEIPTDSEVNDNIVAFWMPEGGGKAGQTYEFNYRLHWGDLPAGAIGDLAYVSGTRAGMGGVAGVTEENGTRKFVIDFKDGVLASLPPQSRDQIAIKATANDGEIVTQSLQPIPGERVWRLVMDIAAEPGTTVEMTASLEGFGQQLTETWSYQWINE